MLKQQRKIEYQPQLILRLFFFAITLVLLNLSFSFFGLGWTWLLVYNSIVTITLAILSINAGKWLDRAITTATFRWYHFMLSRKLLSEEPELRNL